MTFWDKSLRVFKSLRDNATQSVRRLAQKTGLSKSSVHRLQQAIARRDGHPESWLRETEEGHQWLTRLVVATLYTFGLKRGVGMDTMQEFFARLHLATQVGCSPSALRRVMQTLEATILETAATWEKDGVAMGAGQEIIGAVDETFLERMVLILLDLPTGYIVLEATADDRSYATWKALVDQRLDALRTRVRYMVSDRAKALIQLAEKGLECLSMPDFFHLVHDIVKSYSLALGQRLKQAHQELQKAEDRLRRYQEGDTRGEAYREVTQWVAVQHAEVTQWEARQQAYRQQLETLSLTLHPFAIDDSAPQTAAQVEARLHAHVEAIEALAHAAQLPERPVAMTKVEKQLPAVAALVDFWWQGVRRDLAYAAVSPSWQQWAQEALLPRRYWEHQVTRTRCARRTAKMQQVLQRVYAEFDAHVLTHRLPPQALEDWQAWATQQVYAFQRASSAVEGRNGYLAGMHHQQRGLPKRRYKVWTALHNFDMYAADGTTPAARFFKYAFPDLFETVCSNVVALPQPRQRKRVVMLRH
jgi:hypothetical protein